MPFDSAFIYTVKYVNKLNCELCEELVACAFFGRIKIKRLNEAAYFGPVNTRVQQNVSNICVCVLRCVKFSLFLVFIYSTFLSKNPFQLVIFIRFEREHFAWSISSHFN